MCSAPTPSMGPLQGALPGVPGTCCGSSPSHLWWSTLTNAPLLGLPPFPATPLHFQEPALPGITSQTNSLHPAHASRSGLGKPSPTEW